MKKSECLFLACVMTALSMQAFSQPEPPVQTGGEPRAVTDESLSHRLSEDLNGRNDQVGNSSKVNWFDSGHGYYGTYSVGDDALLTTYDKQGNFLNTYSKSDWNSSSVPSSIKASYANSDFKDHQVTGFWTSSDNTGYYLQTRDKNGKVSHVYIDEKGKLSRTPPKVPNKTTPKK